MSTYVLVLRNFSGLTAGEVIDASDWLHTKPLEDDRYVKTLEHVDAEKREECACGLVVLPEARLHDCEALKAKREAAVAEKVAAASQQGGQQGAPATTPAPAPQPAAPAAQKAAAAADKPVANAPAPAPAKTQQAQAKAS